jgi:hypothetical protein
VVLRDGNLLDRHVFVLAGRQPDLRLKRMRATRLPASFGSSDSTRWKNSKRTPRDFSTR